MVNNSSFMIKNGSISDYQAKISHYVPYIIFDSVDQWSTYPLNLEADN